MLGSRSGNSRRLPPRSRFSKRWAIAVLLVVVALCTLLASTDVLKHPGTSLRRLSSGKCSTLPPIPPSTFGHERFLDYSISRDNCTGIKHFTWSITCALGEAIHLNRTFVLDDTYCLNKDHVGSTDHLIRDFRMYFDILPLVKNMKIVSRRDFEQAWRKWDGEGNPYVTYKEVNRHATTKELAQEKDIAVLRRTFDDVDDEYFYQVCTSNPEIERPWSIFWSFAPPLMDIVEQIQQDMGWVYDAVHVRRGDKVSLHRENYPNLDRDTRPESLLQKLPKFIEPGRDIYIATDETTPGFFDPLKSMYTVHLVSDYSHLWQPGSSWWKYARCVYGNSQDLIVFDKYMIAILDYVIFERAVVKVETFKDLTSDPRHGLKCVDCEFPH